MPGMSWGYMEEARGRCHKTVAMGATTLRQVDKGQ